MIRTVLIALALSFASIAPASAASGGGLLMDPRLIQAAIDIQMTDEQIPEFQGEVVDYLKSVGRATQKLLQRNNQHDLEKKIIRKRASLAKKMDKEMAKLLTDEQYPRYEKYRELLLAKLSGTLDGDGEETAGFSNMMGTGS